MNISDFENQAFTTVVNLTEISNIDFQISQYGFETTNANKNPVHSNRSLSLLFIVKGYLYFTVNNQTEKLSKGCIFALLPTRTDVYYSVSKTHPAKYYWLTLTGKEPINYLSLMNFDLQKYYVKIAPHLFQKTRKCFYSNFIIPENMNSITDFYFNENFFHIAKLIYESQSYNNLSVSPKSKTDHIDKALLYIKNHYQEEDLNLAKVAKEIHIHPSYLCSLFKSVVGTSFNAYLTQKRVDQAIVLIRKGMTSVTEIAEMVGIPDASYFTKVFKKVNIATPTEEIAKFKKGKY